MNLSYTLHLQSGSRNADVQALQAALKQVGAGELAVTGFFGRATQAAVLGFQQEQDLPATGVVDEATIAAMSVALEDVGIDGIEGSYDPPHFAVHGYAGRID